VTYNSIHYPGYSSVNPEEYNYMNYFRSIYRQYLLDGLTTSISPSFTNGPIIRNLSAYENEVLITWSGVVGATIHKLYVSENDLPSKLVTVITDEFSNYTIRYYTFDNSKCVKLEFVMYGEHEGAITPKTSKVFYLNPKNDDTCFKLSTTSSFAIIETALFPTVAVVVTITTLVLSIGSITIFNCHRNRLKIVSRKSHNQLSELKQLDSKSTENLQPKQAEVNQNFSPQLKLVATKTSSSRPKTSSKKNFSSSCKKFGNYSSPSYLLHT
jgi:hypothetical protein